MAGIGFRFREMVSEGSYIGILKGFLFSSIFSAGPWIMTMIIIAVLNYLAPPEVGGGTLFVFRATLTYVYALSLAVVGTFQFPLTRYIADRIFEKDRGEILSTYIGSIIFYALVSLLVGSIFLTGNTGGAVYKILFLLLFVTVSLTWNGMVFLTAIKDYAFTIYIFLAGSGASIGLAVIMKKPFGLNGYLCGFFLGQLIIVSGMTAEILREFYNDSGASYQFLKYQKRYYPLLLSGFAYNMGIWTDKLIVWNYCPGECYLGNLRVCAVYDLCVFVSYLSIIPALAYFMIKLETAFYDLYREYFTRIMNKNPLEKINECRDRLVYAVDSSVLELTKLQGTVSMMFYIFAFGISSALSASNISMAIYKYSIIGVFFHVMFLFMTIFMMYFEYYWLLLGTTGYFLISNTLMTYLAVHYNLSLSSGYCLAAATSAVASYLLLRKRLKELVYHTFTSQPISPALQEKTVFSSMKFLESLGFCGLGREKFIEGVNTDYVEDQISRKN